jgi:hypothetical protein
MTIYDSGEWIIDQIKSEAATQGRPLTDEDVDWLRTPIPEMMATGRRDVLLELNNRVVALARSAMERQKASGSPTTRARRGLKIPLDWNRHYQRIFTGNLALLTLVWAGLGP